MIRPWSLPHKPQKVHKQSRDYVYGNGIISSCVEFVEGKLDKQKWGN